MTKLKINRDPDELTEEQAKENLIHHLNRCAYLKVLKPKKTRVKCKQKKCL